MRITRRYTHELALSDEEYTMLRTAVEYAAAISKGSIDLDMANDSERKAYEAANYCLKQFEAADPF